jgi:predicted nucleic acid-binding protein
VTSPVFVDTNVFVYAWDASKTEKQARATAWIRALWDTDAGRISHQVMNELYVTLTRKLQPAIDRATARRYVRTLEAWMPVSPSLGLAWEIEEVASLSFWDALIVAAARGTDAFHLLSEDLAHGHEIAGITIINPFRVDPAQWVKERS